MSDKNLPHGREQAATRLPTSFKVIAGSYEKLLYGLEGKILMDQGEELRVVMTPLFIFPAHVSCIKAVAASPEGGKWLATGSADEIIKIWDLRRRKEVGGLMHHQGSITDLFWCSRSHLISASEDGTLCLFHARDWTVLRVLRGHKGRVNSVAVHPSGKVALSVGKDRALRMWDLMRGKGVASTKLEKEGEVVRWSIDGTTFAVQSGSQIDIYTTNMVLLHTITHSSRIHDILYCRRNEHEKAGQLLLVGAEDRKVSVYRINADSSARLPRVVAEMVGHTNRIKAVRTVEIAFPESSTTTTIACTVSSDGFVNVYDVGEVPDEDGGDEAMGEVCRKRIEPLGSYDSKGTRFTCVALATDGGLDDGKTLASGREEEGGDDDDDDDDSGEGWDGDEDEDVWGGIEVE